MFKLALLPNDSVSRGLYLCGRTLPVKYMEDFSLMGFVVDRYHDAVEVLTTSGFSVEELEGGADLLLHSVDTIQEISACFANNNIQSDFMDIADTIYQA